MTSAREEFTLSGDLPWQRSTAIEASAGTGKTYALSGLVVRYVAERGVPIDEILVVTFTRAATAELHERVRSRLVQVLDGLDALGGGADNPESPEGGDPNVDPVLTLLAGQPDRRAEFSDRLRRAVLDFDSATISTIHGFCSQARTAMGVRFGGNPDAVPAEVPPDLVTSVCNDLFISEALDPGSTWLEDEQFKRGRFQEVVEKVRTLPDSQVASVIDDELHRHLVSLVNTVADRIDERTRAAGAMSYDTLVTSVRDELRDHDDVAEQLRNRFQVALIDEFQDTDSAQWEIFSTVFGPGTGRTLVVVGDPKQAIYAFRGGDVHTYLEAVGSEGVDVLRLAENQRSDHAVVEAVNALAGGHALGSDRIVVERVRPTPRLAGRHLSLTPDGPPAPGVQVRFVTASSMPGEAFNAPDSAARVGDDLVSVVLELLDGAMIRDPGREDRPVRPSDIAVLVSAIREAGPIAEALRDAGVPSVLRLNESVTASEAYEQLATLFDALERPSDRRRAAAAALGWWRGWPSERLAAAAASEDSEEAVELVEFQHQLVGWAAILVEEGLPALYGHIRSDGDFLARMVGTGSGERHLTDLEHLVELVHAERRGGRGMAPTAASAALAGLGSGGESAEMAAEAVQRRVESDAAAVTIMTIHKAKGLEFGVVLIPSLSGGGDRVKASIPYTYYAPPDGAGGTGHRIVDLRCRDLTADDLVDAGGRPIIDPKVRSEEEQCGDQHRMTYVALTRAAHHTVVWWAATPGQRGRTRTGLARLLFSDDPLAGPADEVDLPDPGNEAETVRARIANLGATDWVSVVEVPPPGAPPAPYRPTDDVVTIPEVEPARLARELPRDERRWSYTGLSRSAGHGGPDAGAAHVVADPDDETGADSGADDEPIGEVAPGAPADPPPSARSASVGDWDAPSPLEGLGGGKDFGNMVHTVFEHVDFESDSLHDDLAERIRSDGDHRVDGDDRVERLAAALVQVVRTPLGPAFGDLTMSQLPMGDRLNELRFDLPLSPSASFPGGRIGAVVERHLRGTPYGDWAAGLSDRLGGTPLRGVLTGSIDLVLRRATPSGPVHSVVDYKTNNLTPTGEPHLLRHYDTTDPSVLRRAMLDTDYALQAILYTVVLHRYLRWRQPGYEPSIHLGPIGYLFARGMVGEHTPVDSAGGRAGVVEWRLPVELVVELDRLLANGEDR